MSIANVLRGSTPERITAKKEMPRNAAVILRRWEGIGNGMSHLPGNIKIQGNKKKSLTAMPDVFANGCGISTTQGSTGGFAFPII